MSKAVPWDEAEVRGPKLAYTITPENCGRMLRRAKRLLIVVGGNILDEEYTKAGTLHILGRIVKKTNATLAISAGVFKAFHRFEGAKYAVNVESLVDRLKDGNWMGFDGRIRLYTICWQPIPLSEHDACNLKALCTKH